ncbi:MAG: hypothetical protein IPM12_00325 [Flavobacteriales bacterium]|nr:hypothetical protein [Flavobacteriales bacterium]
MQNASEAQPNGEGTPAEHQKPAEPSGYQQSADLAFCPQKELNLPANYDEVVERFKRLQAGRAMESLN